MHIVLQILIALVVVGGCSGLLVLAMLRRERRMKDTEERVRKYKEHQSVLESLTKVAPDILKDFRDKPSAADESGRKATRTVARSDGTWTLTFRAHGKQETLALTHLDTGSILVMAFYDGAFKGFGDRQILSGTAMPNDATAPIVQELAEEFRQALSHDLAPN